MSFLSLRWCFDSSQTTAEFRRRPEDLSGYIPFATYLDKDFFRCIRVFWDTFRNRGLHHRSWHGERMDETFSPLTWPIKSAYTNAIASIGPTSSPNTSASKHEPESETGHFLYTHSVSHAHFLCTFSLRDVQTSRTRMAEGACSVCVISLHLALSILMFHPPSLLFPHGHFDTTFPSAPSSSSFTRPKSAGQAHLRTSAGEFGYLADPTHSIGFEPKEFEKTTSADGDTTPINDPNHDSVSDKSRTTRENTGLFGVPTVCETSVSHVSHGNFALQRGSQESMPRETVAGQRERERKGEREGSVISVTKSMSKKSRRRVPGVILLRLTENSFLMNEICENTLNEEFNKLFLVKIQFRENYTRLSTTWRPKIWSEETQNLH